MADYLLYWKPDTVDNVVERGGTLNHIASQQIRHRKPGDTVWIVTSPYGWLVLLNRFVIGEIVDRDTAAQRLEDSNLWEADFHALSAAGTDEPLRVVSLDALVRDLRFVSDKDRLVVREDGTLDVQQVRAMRRLTSSSADELARLWEDEEGYTPGEALAADTFLEDLPEEELEEGDLEEEELDDDETPLETVESVAQVRAAIEVFNEEAAQFPDLARAISRAAWYWVHDPESGAFAPSKFVGYQDMDFDYYAGLVGFPSFHGSQTRQAIASLVGEFKPSPELDPLLRAWGDRVLGEAALEGLKPGKWRFATLP